MAVNTKRLRQLIKALRAPMPKGFSWKFPVILEQKDCGSAGCALGLAQTLWGLHVIGSFATPFGIPEEDSNCLFFNTRVPGEVEPFYGVKSLHVRPEMVAIALEQYLLKGKKSFYQR